MLIKKPDDIKSSEITDRKVYLNRRNFMRGAALAASALATGILYRKLLAPDIELPPPSGKSSPGPQSSAKQWGLPGEEATPYKDITTYNNFYEFGTDKYSPARRAQCLTVRRCPCDPGSPRRLGGRRRAARGASRPRSVTR